MTHLRAHACVVVLALAGGCGLISSDVTNFDLKLKDKVFTIDATTWQVDPQRANTYLSTSCASSPNVCSSAAQNACATGCTGTCDAGTRTCDLGLQVNIYRLVDLQMENAELGTLKNEPVIKVSIDTVTYDITDNTLNIATPAMTIYVAPMSVMNPSDPMAKSVGTIDAVPAGTTVAGKSMTYTDAGKQNLVDIMSTFKNPFNVIVGSTLTVKSGDPVPTGKLTAVVHVHAHATL